MRILVCGSRHFNDSYLLYSSLADLKTKGISCIISGHAKGADTLGEEYALSEGIPCEVYPADWETYGKVAGPIRNGEMLKKGKPDMVVAFLAPNSRGTKNMIKQAQDANVPVRIVEIASQSHSKARTEVLEG